MTKNIYDQRNISMVMDLYELTMANGYLSEKDNDHYVTFDVFIARIQMMEVMRFLRD